MTTISIASARSFRPARPSPEQVVGASEASESRRTFHDKVLDGIRKFLDAHATRAKTGPRDFYQFDMRFAVRAFDRVPWPVSVSVDLCVLLEQLPDVVAAADQGRSFELDFFEQGIERTLHAEARDEDFEFSCSCRLETWAPQWRVERVPQVTFRQMLRALIAEFNRLAAAVCPDLVAHPQFVRWADAVRGRVPRVAR